MQQNTASFFAPGFDEQLEAQNIERQRKMAELLRAQGAAPPDQGQMISGRYIGPSPIAGLAKVLQAYQGGQMGREADAKQRSLGEAVSTRNRDEITAFSKAINGTPATEAQNFGSSPERNLMMGEKNLDMTGQAAPDAAIPAQPATAGDPKAAMALALASKNPGLQAWGMQQIMPKTPKWEKAEQPQADGSVKSGFVDVNSKDPWSTFQLGGTAPVKGVAINGQLSNPVTAAPIGAAVPKQPDAPNPGKDLLIPDGKGGWTVNQPMVAAKKDIAAAGKSTTSNTVINAGEKEFSKETGKLDAKQLADMRSKAEAAQSSLGTVENLRAAIKQGVYSGGGAGVKTTAANMINGITGATPKALPGSQLFDAEASKLVLEHIKQLGANPSNADREFIEKTIPNLSKSPEARDAMVNFIEQKSRATIDLYKRADSFARKNHGLGGFSVVDAPAGGGNVFDAADAILQGGK